MPTNVTKSSSTDSASAPNANTANGSAASTSSSASAASDLSGRKSVASERPNSISEALKLIDDVINRDGANLRELVTSEYANLRSAIDNIAPNLGEKVGEYGAQAVDSISGYATQGLDHGKKLASDVDTRVRSNPWAVIGGVALGSLAIGFMLGRANSEKSDLH